MERVESAEPSPPLGNAFLIGSNPDVQSARLNSAGPVVLGEVGSVPFPDPSLLENVNAMC